MIFYEQGDRVRAMGCRGTVIRMEPNWRVWVKLDVGSNPILCDNAELSTLGESRA